MTSPIDWIMGFVAGIAVAAAVYAIWIHNLSDEMQEAIWDMQRQIRRYRVDRMRRTDDSAMQSGVLQDAEQTINDYERGGER